MPLFGAAPGDSEACWCRLSVGPMVWVPASRMLGRLRYTRMTVCLRNTRSADSQSLQARAAGMSR